MLSVSGANAMASDPRYISPSPWPTTERRPLSSGDQEIVLAAEEEGQREGSAELTERGGDGGGGIVHAAHRPRGELRDDFGVGLGLEGYPIGFELAAKFAEVLNDTVVHDGQPIRGVRVGIALRGASMRRPPGMPDARMARQRIRREP